MDARALLAWLERHDYNLSVETREEEFAHTTGARRITYAGRLLIEGPEEPPAQIWDAMRVHRTELLAATAVERPPVAWLEELVSRYQSGERQLWRTRGDGNGNPLLTGISQECLAANVAAFLELDPREGGRLEPIISEALAAKSGFAEGKPSPEQRAS